LLLIKQKEFKKVGKSFHFGHAPKFFKMNKDLFRLLIIIHSLSTWASLSAQVPSYAWGHSWGSPANESVISIELDSLSNVYVAGRFRGTIDFDPGPDTVAMTSYGNGVVPSVYIIKFDRDGQLLWVKVIGSTGGMDVVGIVKCPDDNYFITGTFSGEGDFDPGPDQLLLTANNQDTYLMKMDPDGQLLWAKAIGGDGDEYFTCLSFDADGNIITGGFFLGTADLDPGPGEALFTFMGTAVDGIDMFAAKYTSTGDYIWGKQFPGDSLAFFNDLIVDPDGNLNFLGAFYDKRDFDPGPDSVTLNTAGEADMFLLKLNASGDFQWVKQIGGIGDDSGNGFVQNESGDFLITGYFHDDVDFDPGPPLQLFSANQMDVFLLSLDYNGEFKWLHTIGGNSNDFARVIRRDPAGNLYVMGHFADTVDFDPGIEVHTLSDIGQTEKLDVFILKLDPSGNYRWVYQLGGPGNDRSGEVRFDSEGKEIFLTGLFEQKAILSPGLTGMDTVTAVGTRDVFLAKWTQCFETYGSFGLFTCQSYTSPSGNYTWTESGVYLDTIQNKAGCDSIITITLTVSDLGLNVHQEGNILVGEGGVGQYFWLDCDHNYEQVGEGSVFTPAVNGNYAVAGSGFACTDTSECFAFVMTSIEDNNVEEAFSIFPNPSTGFFTINLHQEMPQVDLSIFDTFGRKIYAQHFSGLVTIPVNVDIPAGLYFVTADADGHRMQKKIFIQ